MDRAQIEKFVGKKYADEVQSSSWRKTASFLQVSD